MFIWSILSIGLANTITVTSGSSIQSAINAANSGDTIQIQTGTYLDCINPNGKNLDFVGVGTVVLNGSSCTNTVTINGSEQVSFSNLQMSHSNGLVIRADSLTSGVELDSVTISNSGYNSQSSSSLGGVIYSAGTVLIENSTFSANTGGLGGVIYMDGGILEIHNSSFSFNSALKGGVIYAIDGTMISSNNNTFTNNNAINSGFGGVVALNFGAEYTDVGSVYADNFAESHGGVVYTNHNIGASVPNIIDITDSSFTDNYAGSSSIATGNGGVFYIYNTSTVDITNSVFTGNTASGGGVAWIVGADGLVTITDSTFDQNSVNANQGGAIAVMAFASTSPTNVAVYSSIFTDNSVVGSFGGAISLGNLASAQSHGSLWVEDSFFSGNSVSTSSSAHGGAILVNTASNYVVDIQNSVFDANTAFTSGGAVYIQGAGSVDVGVTRFLENTATSAASYDRYGGALYVGSVGNVSVSNTVFCGNAVTQYPTKIANGAAVYMQNVSAASVQNSIFQDNISDQKGGGVSIASVTAMNLLNNTFVGNSATEGAGLWVSSTNSTVQNTIFSHHTGAAMYAADTTSASGGASYGNWYSNTSNTAGSYNFSTSTSGNLTQNPNYIAYSQDGDCSNDNLALSSTSTLIDAGNPSILDADGSRSDIGAFGGAGLVDADNDGFSSLVDCDDSNADVYPGAAFHESTTACREDSDGDGYGDSTPSSLHAQPGTDCDDSLHSIHPNANELCDSIDNNCNNQIDENPTNGFTYYLDVDGDGYGGTAQNFCTEQQGYIEISGDCDDTDAFVHPGAAENESGTACMQDHDQDGYGDSNPSNSSVMSGSDCDDTQSFIYTGATEIVADGMDQNCDGYEACYVDLDRDGYGGNTTTNSASFSCTGLSISAFSTDCDDGNAQTFPGAAENESSTACMTDEDGDGYGYIIGPDGGVGGNDCDDADPQVYLGATEIPGDGISQDCDNTEDCFQDLDGDGFGSSVVIRSNDLDCQDAGEATNSNDCDDDSADVAPTIEEIPYDGLDNDCDSSTLDDDLDQDGFTVEGGDCDDSNPDINPSATDIADDEIDQDCDGLDATSDTAEPSNEPSIDTDDVPKDTKGCSSASIDASWCGVFGILLVGYRRRK